MESLCVLAAVMHAVIVACEHQVELIMLNTCMAATGAGIADSCHDAVMILVEHAITGALLDGQLTECSQEHATRCVVSRMTGQANNMAALHCNLSTASVADMFLPSDR